MSEQVDLDAMREYAGDEAVLDMMREAIAEDEEDMAEAIAKIATLQAELCAAQERIKALSENSRTDADRLAYMDRRVNEIAIDRDEARDEAVHQNDLMKAAQERAETAERGQEAWRIMYRADVGRNPVHGGLSCDAAEEDRYGLGAGYAELAPLRAEIDVLKDELQKSEDALVGAADVEALAAQQAATIARMRRSYRREVESCADITDDQRVHLLQCFDEADEIDEALDPPAPLVSEAPDTRDAVIDELEPLRKWGHRLQCPNVALLPSQHVPCECEPERFGYAAPPTPDAERAAAINDSDLCAACTHPWLNHSDDGAVCLWRGVNNSWCRCHQFVTSATDAAVEES